MPLHKRPTSGIQWSNAQLDEYMALSAAGGEGHAPVVEVDDGLKALVEAYAGYDSRVVGLVNALGSVMNTSKLHLEHVLNARVPDQLTPIKDLPRPEQHPQLLGLAELLFDADAVMSDLPDHFGGTELLATLLGNLIENAQHFAYETASDERPAPEAPPVNKVKEVSKGSGGLNLPALLNTFKTVNNGIEFPGTLVLRPELLQELQVALVEEHRFPDSGKIQVKYVLNYVRAAGSGPPEKKDAPPRAHSHSSVEQVLTSLTAVIGNAILVCENAPSDPAVFDHGGYGRFGTDEQYRWGTWAGLQSVKNQFEKAGIQKLPVQAAENILEGYLSEVIEMVGTGGGGLSLDHALHAALSNYRALVTHAAMGLANLGGAPTASPPQSTATPSRGKRVAERAGGGPAPKQGRSPGDRPVRYERMIGGNPANPTQCGRPDCKKYTSSCWFSHTAKPEPPAGGAGK